MMQDPTPEMVGRARTLRERSERHASALAEIQLTFSAFEAAVDELAEASGLVRIIGSGQDSIRKPDELRLDLIAAFRAHVLALEKALESARPEGCLDEAVFGAAVQLQQEGG